MLGISVNMLFCVIFWVGQVLVFPRNFPIFQGNVSLKGKQVLVFVSSQKRADRLAQLLNEDGFHSAALHALYSPTKREKTIQDFKEGIIQV